MRDCSENPKQGKIRFNGLELRIKIVTIETNGDVFSFLFNSLKNLEKMKEAGLKYGEEVEIYVGTKEQVFDGDYNTYFYRGTMNIGLDAKIPTCQVGKTK